MTQSISQIRTDIENTKEHISQTVGELEGRLDELKDWHTVVNRFPVATLVISFGLGFLVANRRTKHVAASGVRGSAKGAGTLAGSIISGALTGLATKKLTEYLGGLDQRQEATIVRN